MSERQQQPAFTAPLYAFVRQGGKETGQVLQAFPDSMRPVEEPGTLGNPTPQMITNATHPELDNSGLLARYSSEQEADHGQDQGMEMES